MDTVDARLTTHEEVCAERYGNLVNRITRLEMVVMVSAGTLICGMGGVLATIFFKGA